MDGVMGPPRSRTWTGRAHWGAVWRWRPTAQTAARPIQGASGEAGPPDDAAMSATHRTRSTTVSMGVSDVGDVVVGPGEQDAEHQQEAAGADGAAATALGA
jgi:hypothetical protein